MEHDAHLAENVDQAGGKTKIITLVILAGLAAFAIWYVFFGPGL